MQPKLKILFANSIQMFAGGEIWMLNTIEALQQRGHAITLLCRPGTELARRAAEKGIDLFLLKLRGDFDPVTIFQIYRWLKQHRPDVILTNMDKELRLCGSAAKLAGKPVVISRRGIDYPLKDRIHYRLTYNYLTDRVVANSESTKRSLLKNTPWLGADRIQVIYNGIQPENYAEIATRDLRAELELLPGAPIVGFVGQLNERKGFDALLPAFQRLVEKVPAAVLLLAGVGDLQPEIEAFVRAHGLQKNIRLLGFRNDIPNLMRTIDLLVLPSWWEGFGIVLIEAMAAGKPTITTNISSMPEIVAHRETGLIIPPHDATACFQALLEMVTQPDWARELGRHGLEAVHRRFTLTRMVDQYEAFFAELVEKNN
jgi:glycosyltransferase involved in cell wall biosynthesis